MLNRYLLAFLLPTLITAQPYVGWLQRYNGPDDGGDHPADMLVGPDRSIYVAGSSENADLTADIVTIRYYPTGETAWVRRYDGPARGNDFAAALACDQAGNVYVAGTSDIHPGPDTTRYDFALIKYDPDGARLWVRTHDRDSGADEARALAVDAAGNAYVAGSSSGSSPAAVVVKYSPDGVEQWVRSWQETGAIFYDAALDPLGDLCLAGRRRLGNYDMIAARYRPNGDSLWHRSYDGGDDEGMHVATDRWGSVYVGGYSGTWENACFCLVRYTPDGTRSWVRTYDGPRSSDYLTALAVDSFGHIVVTGWSEGLQNDIATLMYDTLGTRRWLTRYATAEREGPNGIAVDPTGGIYVTGYVGAYGWGRLLTIKYDTLGREAWHTEYSGPGQNEENCHIAVHDSFEIYVAAASMDVNEVFDILTINYEPYLAIAEPASSRPGPGADRLTAPALCRHVAPVTWRLDSDRLRRLLVCDAAGRVVRDLTRECAPAAAGSVTWDLSAADGRRVGRGIYFLRLETASGRAGRRLAVR